MSLFGPKMFDFGNRNNAMYVIMKEYNDYDNILGSTRILGVTSSYKVAQQYQDSGYKLEGPFPILQEKTQIFPKKFEKSKISGNRRFLEDPVENEPWEDEMWKDKSKDIWKKVNEPTSGPNLNIFDS